MELAKVEQPQGAITDYSGGLLEVIARAARDPNVDIDKMERLLEMQQRVEAQLAKRAFTEAKIAMREELPEVTMKGRIIIKKDGTVIQETPFARFEDIHEAVTPVLTRYGFDLKFRNGLAPDGKVRVTTILSHVKGHEEETNFDLPHDASGSKNSVQAVGSSTSYGKRYGTLSILNIKVAGEDDDAQAASYQDPSGEPLPRAKLDGPHASKTALKAAVGEIRNEVSACRTVEHLNAIIKAGRATIDQAERDWKALLDGFPNVPEDVGLKGVVAGKRKELADGGMLAGLLSSMRNCATLSGLSKWCEHHAEVIEALDGQESRKFQHEYDAYQAGLNLETKVNS